jgi:hypothetical protein
MAYKVIEVCKNLKGHTYERAYTYANGAVIYFRTKADADERGRIIALAKYSKSAGYRVARCRLPVGATYASF